MIDTYAQPVITVDLIISVPKGVPRDTGFFSMITIKSPFYNPGTYRKFGVFDSEIRTGFTIISLNGNKVVT